MKKISIISALVLSILAGLADCAMCENINKVAIVNLQEVVAESAQVKALRKEEETKLKELQTFLEKARKEIAGTTDLKKKQNLEDKYYKEFNAKREEIGKNYTKKLSDLDTSISNEISNYAKSQGYDIVLNKSVVLYGGDDITEEIKNALK